jgi:predicted O-methyltransferase YrrM
MSQQSWTEVDSYIAQSLIPDDPTLDQVLQANHAAGLVPYDVAPNQGKFLYLLAKIRNARRILEIGTLGGYSTIWLARALPPGGKVITLEINIEYAQVAKRNIEFAGVADRVEIRVGPAVESLVKMDASGEVDRDGKFDLVFIDADKPNNPEYLKWALKFSKQGTVIIGDNVVRDGAVVDGESKDESVQGVRQFFEMLRDEKRVDATALQTVGSKGWDGFALAVVTDDVGGEIS